MGYGFGQIPDRNLFRATSERPILSQYQQFREHLESINSAKPRRYLVPLIVQSDTESGHRSSNPANRYSVDRLEGGRLADS
jgi:hypothetical protein